MREQHGKRIQMTFKSLKGECYWGHKVGDQCEVSMHETGGICGALYASIYTKLHMLQFGGKYPWQPDGGVTGGECPDPYNRVEVELRTID